MIGREIFVSNPEQSHSVLEVYHIIPFRRNLVLQGKKYQTIQNLGPDLDWRQGAKSPQTDEEV
jgi:hypothetical protein